MPTGTWVATLAGIFSLALMFYGGRHQRSIVLIAMFTLWVAAPFAGAIWAARIRHARSAAITAVVVCSAAFYALATFGPVNWKPGFVFLVVPALTWAAIVPLAILRPR